MSSSTATIEQLFDRQIQTLALTRRPSTIQGYRTTAHRFLSYLRPAFPDVSQLSDLRRDPHLLGWFRSLADQPHPPLSTKSRWNYLLLLRRLFDELAAEGHFLAPSLIRPGDFPRLPIYLPRALSLADDQRLQNELRRLDDCSANALLLLRLTGIRIGECLDLPLHCLTEIAPGGWALHVPLGKLHTERQVPADEAIRHCVARLQALRPLDPLAAEAAAQGMLLPRRSRSLLYEALRLALVEAAQRAGCTGRVTPHVLRHSFATEMMRLGVSLPALMQLLGHKSIRMTMRYVQVTQLDVQREFHAARCRAAAPHTVPFVSLPPVIQAAGLSEIQRALAATRHLLEMYRRGLDDQSARRKLARLDDRLRHVESELVAQNSAEK